MNPQRGLTLWLLANRSRALALAALIALLMGLVVSNLVRELREADQGSTLQAQAHTRAAAVQAATLSGEAIGVAKPLGLAEPALKSAVSGNSPPDDRSALAPLRIAHGMLDAEDVFVLNADGDVVLHVGHPPSFTGKNFGFRPYFARAITGQTAVYAALGAAAGMAIFALLWLALRLLGSSQARAEAQAAQQRAVAELAAASEVKTLLADFILGSQEARALQELASLFFHQLKQGYPLHQGTLYLMEPDPPGVTQREPLPEHAPIAEPIAGPISGPPSASVPNPTQATAGEEPSPALRLVGDYAATAAPPRILLGEGLLGECALQGRALAFDDPPDGFWRISSGLGETRPRRLDLLPLRRQHRLLGVLELASLERPTPAAQALLDGLLPLLVMQLAMILKSTPPTGSTAEQAGRQPTTVGETHPTMLSS